MVSAWSSHDLDETNQETPYRPVRCLTNTRHCAAFLCINQYTKAAALPACLLPACCVALGLWLGPPLRASWPVGEANRPISTMQYISTP